MSSTGGGPLVAVIRDPKKVAGVAHLGELAGAEAVQVFDAASALEREWDTDAHVLLYMPVPYSPGEPVVRLKKSSLRSIRDAGGDVRLRRILLDYDTPGHAPWTRESWAEFESTLDAVERTPFGEKLRAAFAFYTTRRGARWWLELEEPDGVGVEHGEPLIAGVVEEARAAGLLVDASPTVLTWTQPFRLPWVMRKTGKTRDDWPGICLVEPRARISSTRFSPSRGRASVAAAELDAEQPSPDDASSLLWDRSGPKEKQTEWMRSAKSRLAGREYSDAVFGFGRVDLPEGDRHRRIDSWVNSAASLLANEEGTDAARIYAVFLPYVEQLDDEGGRRDWGRELWRMVLHAWGREVAKAEKVEREEAERHERAAHGFERVVEGAREWHPALPSDPEQATARIRRMLIIATRDDKYFPLMRNGRYSQDGVSARQLPARIRQLGMDDHVPLTVETREGRRPATFAEITHGRMIVAARSRVEPEIDGAYVDRPDDEDPEFVRRSFRLRRDVAPAYSPDVDAWMGSFPRSDRLRRQVAAFLSFKAGPASAISIVAKSGAGKKLLAHGLEECLEVPMLSHASDLTERFNERIARSPFMWLNEGALLKWGHRHASDAFRSFSSGDRFSVEAKGRDLVESNFPIRFLFTANNEKLILQLCEGRDLDPADREAISLRLCHYDCGDGPSEFLRRAGGEAFTDGWIGSAGKESRLVVARHFLWLRAELGPSLVAGTRHGFLVEGDLDSPIVRSMQIQGGSTPAVIECLVKLVASKAMGGQESGVKVHEGRLYVSAGAILDYWRKNLSQGSADRLTIHKIKSSLRGLVVGESAKRRIEGEEARWNEVDVLLVAEEAERNGWMNPQVEALAKMRAGLPAPGAGGTNGAVHAPHAGSVFNE